MLMHSLDDSNETREEYQGKERPGSKRPGTSGSSSSYATSSVSMSLCVCHAVCVCE